MVTKSKPKEYLVESNQGDWYNTWVVKANNAKEAINAVWTQEHFDLENKTIRAENKKLGYYATALYKKSEFTARSLSSLRQNDRDVILIY